jgi:hypothetical protein
MGDDTETNVAEIKKAGARFHTAAAIPMTTEPVVTQDPIPAEPVGPAQLPATKSHRRPKLKTAPLLVIVILILGVSTGVLAWKYHQAQQQIAHLSNPQVAADLEVARVVNEVGALVSLPHETPSLATVTDPSRLQDQPFFATAMKGDKVLIFPNAKRAVLYRPSTNKVIESAPVNLNTGDSNAATQPTNTGSAATSSNPGLKP